MNPSALIHERLMNRSRTILPRVGGGVGVGGEGVGRVSHSCFSSAHLPLALLPGKCHAGMRQATMGGGL